MLTPVVSAAPEQGLAEIITTRATIVSKVPYQENDLVLGLLTRNDGPVSVLARAARSSRRRFSGVLDLFVVFDATYSAGRGGLPVLSSADPVKFFPGIHDSLDRLESGQAMIQSTRDMLRDAPALASAFDDLILSFGYLETALPELSYLVHLEAVLSLAAELGHVPVDGVCPGCGFRSGRFVATSDGMVVCVDRCAHSSGPSAAFPPVYLERRPLVDNPALARAPWQPGQTFAAELVSILVAGVTGISMSSKAHPEQH